MEPPKAESLPDIDAKTFTFRELAAATRNFRQECLLGEGAFGRVYKGKLENTGQVNNDLTTLVVVHPVIFLPILISTKK